MTRLHHPVTIPGLLPEPYVPGTFLVLDAAGGVQKAGGGGGPGDPPNPPHRPITIDDLLTKEPWPTGPTSGGLITITGTNEVTIAAGEGVIVDSWTDPYNVTVDKVSWVEQSIDFGPVTTRAYSFVYIDPAGVFKFFTARPDPALIRKNIWMARIVHDISDGSVISIRPAHMIPAGTAQMFADYMLAIGIPILVQGADVIGNPSLTFGTSDSRWFGPGESWQQDKDDPNYANNPGANPQSFYYMRSDGILDPPGITTLVTPDVWENPLGTLDSVSPGPNTSTIQRLWTSISGAFVMTYGQREYATLEDARNAISEDNALFVKPQYLSDERATLVAYFVMEHSATDLLNGIDVLIVSPEGTPVSGGASGPHTHDAVYLRLDAANDPMQQNLDMGLHQINNLLDGVLATDAVALGQISATGLSGLHDDLLDVSSDQHHPQVHAHDGGDGSGTVAHAATTGRTANDHHNQIHLLYGSDHSDVDIASPLVDRNVLAVSPGPGDWTPELRMNWRNQWIQGTYYTHDVVRDGDYLMAANKQTTDRPSPVPVGDASFLLPDIPTWNILQYTGNVYSGMHIDVPAGELYELQAVRVWIESTSPDAHYQVVIYDAVTGRFNLGSTFEGDVLDSPGWLTVQIAPIFVSDTDDFYVLVRNWNSAGTTNYNHPWVRGVNTNLDNDPGAGNWNQDNNSTRLRISATDDDALPRQAELAAVTPGTLIQLQDEADLLAYTQFEVINIVDNGTWFLYDVALVDTGVNGPATIGLRQQAYFEVPIQAATEYVTLTNHFATSPNIDGYLSFDEVSGGIDTDDGYGIDMQLQAYTASADWDLMALTGGSGGAGGGEGTNPLPIGGSAGQALTKIDAADYNVEWSGPYLPLAGGALTGFLTLHADPTAALHAATKQYVDGAGFSGDHDDLTNVTASQHHVRYDDTEARAAVAGLYLLLTGGTLTGFLTLHADPTVALHAATKGYVDTEVAGVDPSGVYLPLAGGALTGFLSLHADPTQALHASTKQYTDTKLDSTHTADVDAHHARYTDAEAIAAVGPHTTLLNDLTDVDVSGASDLQVLSYNAIGGIWEPKENRSNKGIISLEYVYDANQSAVPASGDVSPNNADPSLTTILRISDTDANGDSVGFVLSNITQGDLIVIAPRTNDSIREDYTVVSSVDQGTYHDITVTYTSHAGTILDDTPVFFYMFQTIPDIDSVYLRLDTSNDPLTGDLLLAGPPSLDLHAATKKYVDDSVFSGSHADLTGVTADQHHARYTDAEAIAAVGPHTPPQTYLHADLIDVTPDQHHARYTDDEARLATADHFTQTDAPVNPTIGTVWVNPSEPPEATYLPLTGGTLTGNLVLDGGYLTIQRSGSGMLWFKRTSVPESGDGWYQIQIQAAGGWSLYGGSLDGTTRPQREIVRVTQESVTLTDIALDFDGRDASWQYLRKKTGPGFLFETAAGQSMRHYDVTTLLWDSSATAFRSYKPIWSEHSDGFSSRAAVPVIDFRPSGSTTYRFSFYNDTDRHMKLFSNEHGNNVVQVRGDGYLYVSSQNRTDIGATVLGPVGISYRGITHSGHSANWIGFTWGSSAIWGTIDNVVTIQVSNSSDRRLKHNPVPVTDALSMVLAMPDTYSYQPKGFDGVVDWDADKLYGMMADEMEPVFPELVTGDGQPKEVKEEDGTTRVRDTYQSIDYVTVVPLLVEAIKELTAEVRGG
jgi:hypothetical protein